MTSLPFLPEIMMIGSETPGVIYFAHLVPTDTRSGLSVTVSALFDFDA
jgi:hypothetical protein